MTVLQFRGPMAFRVLQWCHPMLASSLRTSCCTRMITLYGTRKWIQARAEHTLASSFCSLFFFYPFVHCTCIGKAATPIEVSAILSA